MDLARRVWQRLETVHAVTYFAPESRRAASHAGLRGFWMGYFAFRAAPLGPVGPDVVTDAFWNFAPRMVERAIPDAWSHATPAALLSARAAAAGAALRRLAPGVSVIDPRDLRRLDDIVRAVPAGPGRQPLFRANTELPAPGEPVEDLWQACTTIREHRGDAHVDALRAADLDGCAAHVLFAAAEHVPVEVLRDNRGWTETEWGDARERLTARGLLASDGSLTDRGEAWRADVEHATDAATRALLGADAAWVLGVADPIAGAVAASGTIPYPNPMGLPPLG